MLRFLSLSVAVTLALLQPAAAQLVVCNKTAAPVSLAIASETDEDVVSQGWWTIDPTKCENAINGELKRQYYYHYAFSKEQNVEWGGTYNFCVKDDPQFRSVGSNECEQRNMRTAGFRQTDVGRNKMYVLDISMGPQAVDANAAAEKGDGIAVVTGGKPEVDPIAQAIAPATTPETEAATGTPAVAEPTADPAVAPVDPAAAPLAPAPVSPAPADSGAAPAPVTSPAPATATPTATPEATPAAPADAAPASPTPAPEAAH